MRRLLFFLVCCILISSAIADNEQPAIHVFFKDGTMISFLREQVDSISYSATDKNPEKTQLQSIHLKESTNAVDMVIEDIDSVVFTPPSYFFWALTKTSYKETYLTATLQGFAGGKIKKGSSVETGFLISETDRPLNDEGAIKIVCGNSLGEFETTVTNEKYGFVGGRYYYFQAYNKVDGVKRYGLVKSFRLKPVNVTTLSSAKVYLADDNHYHAIIKADIFGDTDEIAQRGSRIGFYYGTEDDPRHETENVKEVEGTFDETKDIVAELDHLEHGTKYFYQAFVEIAQNIYYGGTEFFITDPLVEVITNDATDIGAASANTTYKVNVKMNKGQLKNGVVGIQFSTTDNLDQLDESSYFTLDNWSPDSEGKYSAYFSKLKPKTTYYYRAFATIDGTRYYGNMKNFTTKNITVITYDASNITANTAHLEGELLDKDAINAGDKFGFYINTTGNPGPDNARDVYGIFSEQQNNGKFYWDAPDLDPAVTYYYRAYITYYNITCWGDVKSFTTEGEQGFFGELGLFELKGHVKSYTYTTVWGSTLTRTFNNNGFWQTYNGTMISSIYDEGIKRDNYGRIIEGCYEGGGESWTYDEKGRGTSYTEVYYDGGETQTFTYDDNDLMIKKHVEMLGMDTYWNEDYDETYSDYILDSHGNWISRTVHNPHVGSVTETRQITYY